MFFKLTASEIKKLLCKKYILIAVLCLTAALGGYTYTVFHYERTADRMGEPKLYENLTGWLTEEKYNFLLNEMQELQQYYPGEGGNANEEQSGKYMPTRTGDALIVDSAIREADYIFVSEENRRTIMQRAAENIEEYTGRTEGDYRYRIAFNRKVIETYENQPQVQLMSSNSKIPWMSYFMSSISAPLILLLLILAVTPVFVQEKETGMQNLLDTYRHGKTRLFFAKFAAAALVSVAIAVYFELMNLIFYKLVMPDMAGIGCTVQTLFPQCPFDLTIWQFVLVKLLYVSLAALLTGSVILLFSVLFSKRLLCIGASAIFVFASYGAVFYHKLWMPEVMRDSLLQHQEAVFSTLKTYLFTYLFSPLDYYKKFECVNVLQHPFFPQTIVICITVLSVLLVFLAAYLLYRKPKKVIL